MSEYSADEMQSHLNRLQAGDLSVRDDLIRLTQDRLTRLARRMLRDFPGVHRWEDTDDVFQNAVLRLHRSLSAVSPSTPEDYLRLAAVHVRRELIDLSRRYFGPQGHGTHHDSGFATVDGRGPFDRSHDSLEPSRLAMWAEFHAHVESLPDADRALFDLLWYQGLTQTQASVILGVTERTVQRRWQQLRLNIYRDFKGVAPVGW